MSFYLYIVIAFLLGGIPFGLIAGYLAGKGDIRKLGSGNIGATNVWRTAGAPFALITFAGDIGKGVVAVLLASAFFRQGWPIDITQGALIGGVAAILGHIFSPYLGFRGGKGVNTALGVFIVLTPLEIIIAFGVFIIVVAASRYVSLGSMIAVFAFALALWLKRFAFGKPVDGLYLIVSLLLMLFIIFTHRENIRRLLKGTENHFHLRGSAE